MTQDYSGMSREDLIQRLLLAENTKKYGLVWEEKGEAVVDLCQTNLPVLKEIEGKRVGNNKDNPTNIMIEGDNYHALSALNYTHAGKIDVIYIDPPYNTGARDWKYNNNYVDKNDSYRHSKWIAMMEKRLRLAKNLLKQDGVLIVTIDDNEFCSLGLLLDEIFPGKVRTTVVIKYNPAGTARSGFSRCHEYAVYLLNPGQKINKKPAPPDIRSRNLRRNGNNSNRNDAPSMFYPIFIDKRTLKVIGCGNPPSIGISISKQMFEKENYYEVWPLDDQGKEKNWYYSKKRVSDRGREELECKWVKGRLNPYFSTSNNSEQKYQTIWTGPEYDAGAYGSTLVKNMVQAEFPFPKSLYAVRDCIKAVLKSKTATVLDFFAGSGTTGHAVLLLNQEDGGGRKFILCTNNENDIAKNVCYPRIKVAIEGNKDIPEITGFSANLRYFKTDFVPWGSVSDDVKYAMVRRSTEMICVKEDCFEEVLESEHIKIFKNASCHTAILFHLDQFDEFKQALQKLSGPIHIYIFSLTNDTYEDDFVDLGQEHILCPISESILEVYRKIFRESR